MTLNQLALDTGALAPAIATSIGVRPDRQRRPRRRRCSRSRCTRTPLGRSWLAIAPGRGPGRDGDPRALAVAGRRRPPAFGSRDRLEDRPQLSADRGEATRATTPPTASARLPGGDRAHRLAKLDALRERGVEPYPVRFDRDSHRRRDPRATSPTSAPGADSGERVAIAGRVIALRRHGGLDFADLRDETGEDPADRDPRRRSARTTLHDLDALDLGDWIGVEGHRRDRRRPRRALGPDRASSSCSRRRSGRCRTCATASPTPRPATASATST